MRNFGDATFRFCDHITVTGGPDDRRTLGKEVSDPPSRSSATSPIPTPVKTLFSMPNAAYSSM